jgi:hypothetical protein
LGEKRRPISSTDGHHRDKRGFALNEDGGNGRKTLGRIIMYIAGEDQGKFPTADHAAMS